LREKGANKGRNKEEKNQRKTTNPSHLFYETTEVSSRGIKYKDVNPYY
jgi:hypothetical protein